jgi:hypothetical protein
MKVYVIITYDRTHRHTAPDVLRLAAEMLAPLTDSRGMGGTLPKTMMARQVIEEVITALHAAKERSEA